MCVYIVCTCSNGANTMERAINQATAGLHIRFRGRVCASARAMDGSRLAGAHSLNPMCCLKSELRPSYAQIFLHRLPPPQNLVPERRLPMHPVLSAGHSVPAAGAHQARPAPAAAAAVNGCGDDSGGGR